MNEWNWGHRRSGAAMDGEWCPRGRCCTARPEVDDFDLEVSRRPTTPAEAVPGALVAHRTGRWFITPSGVRVDLRSRKNLTVLMRRLGEQRCDAPNTLLSAEALIADVWPGEKILRRPGRNRLHVAIRALRRMGIGALLRFDSGGYQLDPAVPFEFVDGDDG